MSYRQRKLEGRDHYVVPVVLVVEGVLNGSQGALFYPGEELRSSVQQWQGRPLVVEHPLFSSQGISGDPEVFDRQKVGTLFNVRFADHRLAGEAWIDIERARKIEPRILDSIHQGHTVEVSTGLSVERDDTGGIFNGRRYDAIARDHAPDHLAILPDYPGACSIIDGCGLVRNFSGVPMS